MAIPVTCVCGNKLNAKDESAGKTARCPACSVPIVITAQSMQEIFLGIDTSDTHARVDERLNRRKVIGKKGRGAGTPFRIALGAIGSTGVIALCVFIGTRQRSSREVESAPLTTQSVQATAETNSPVNGKDNTDGVIARNNQDTDRLRALFEKASSLYAEDSDVLIRLIQHMIAEAEKGGQKLTPEEALEGSLRWPMPGYFYRSKKSEFREYYALYLTMRLKDNTNHKETIRQLHVLASALHLKSKKPTDEAFNMAFEHALPGCQLAMAESHDLVRLDDPLAEYYGTLADQVAKLYGVQSSVVAAMTSYAGVQAQLANVGAYPAEILEGALKWTPLFEQQEKSGRPPKLDDFLDLYLQLRVKGRKSHADAIAALCAQEPDDRSRVSAASVPRSAAQRP